MPVEVHFDFQDIVNAIRGIEGFEARADYELETVLGGWIVDAQDWIADYPPQAADLHVEFVSDKQRRWFFWALSEGLIEVPYRRTTTLGSRWKHELRHVSEGVRATLSNPTEYMPYVQDAEHQSRMHAGRWKTVQEIEGAHRTRWDTDWRSMVARLAAWTADQVNRLTGRR